MIRSHAMALAVCALPCGSAIAEDKNAYMFGIGLSSCAYWQSSQSKIYEGTVWIYGYWSGLNSLNPSDSLVGSRTDGAGIIAEVKKVCEGRPSMTLNRAITDAYFDMSKGK